MPVAICLFRIAQQHTNLTGVLFAEFDYDLPGAVGRSIFTDNNLVSKVHLLRQDAVYRL